MVNLKIFRFLIKFLVSVIGNVEGVVWRINILILGCKGFRGILRYYFFFCVCLYGNYF